MSMRFVLSTIFVVLVAGQTVTATWNKGCGGDCGSPCSGGYGGCGGGESAAILETSGCAGGACVSSGGGGGGYHTQKTTTIVKEERNDEVSLTIGGGGGSSHGGYHKQYVQPEVHHSGSYVQAPVEIIKKKTIISTPQVRTWVEPLGTIVKKKTTYIDAPAPIVHQSHHRSHHESYVEEPSVDTVVTKRKTTYVSAPVREYSGYTKQTYVEPVQPVITRKTTYVTAPVVHKTTVYKEPIVVHKHRYVESSSAPLIENECVGPCGGSKIVKIIKKTAYNDESCSACGGQNIGGGGGSSYSGRYESYSEPETIVTKKVTKIITEGPGYSSGGDCYGGNCGGGGGGRGRSGHHLTDCPAGECGGYGSSGKSGSYAYSSSSSSSSSSGSYSGGGGGGCKTGCDQWKK